MAGKKNSIHFKQIHRNYQQRTNFNITVICKLRAVYSCQNVRRKTPKIPSQQHCLLLVSEAKTHTHTHRERERERERKQVSVFQTSQPSLKKHAHLNKTYYTVQKAFIASTFENNNNKQTPRIHTQTHPTNPT